MAEVIVLDDSDSDAAPPPPPRRPASSASHPPPPPSDFLSNLRRTIESRPVPVAPPSISTVSPEIAPPRRRGRGRGRDRGSKRASGDVPPSRSSPECNNPLDAPFVSTTPFDRFELPPPLEFHDEFGASPPLSDFSAPPSLHVDIQFERPIPSAPYIPSTAQYRPPHAQNGPRPVHRAAPAQETAPDVSVADAAPSRPSTAASRPAAARAAARRDRVDIFLSRELAARPDGLALLGKLITCEDTSATVASLAESNMLEWRRVSADGEDIVDCVAFYFAAETFVNLITCGDVEGVARRLRDRHPDVQVYFLLHGVHAFCRKAARRLLRPSAAGMDGDGAVVSQMAVDDWCTFLYLEFDIRSRMFATAGDAALFCMCVAEAVAKRPYVEELSFACLRAAYVRGKTGRAGAALCVQGGDVRAEGRDDLGKTYQAFLGLVPGVSVSRAQAIRRVYPTMAGLLEAYGRCGSEEEREGMLADVVESGRRIGPALSKTIARVLTCRNATVEVGRG